MNNHSEKQHTVTQKSQEVRGVEENASKKENVDTSKVEKKESKLRISQEMIDLLLF